MKKILLIIIGAIALLVMAGVGIYNGLVGNQQSVDGAWANVSSSYQRRADLIPNLVKTVQGSANFEKSVLENVTNARASVGKVTLDTSKAPVTEEQLQEFQKAQNSMGGALSRLLVVSENYPDLKASASFRDLQAQIEGTENRINVDRNKFNEAVQSYNASIKKVPAVFFAAILGFQPRPYFKADAGAEKAPEVNFEFGK